MNAYVICAGVTAVCAALAVMVYATFRPELPPRNDDDLPDGWC